MLINRQEAILCSEGLVHGGFLEDRDEVFVLPVGGVEFVSPVGGPVDHRHDRNQPVGGGELVGVTVVDAIEMAVDISVQQRGDGGLDDLLQAGLPDRPNVLLFFRKPVEPGFRMPCLFEKIATPRGARTRNTSASGTGSSTISRLTRLST